MKRIPYLEVSSCASILAHRGGYRIPVRRYPGRRVVLGMKTLAAILALTLAGCTTVRTVQYDAYGQPVVIEETSPDYPALVGAAILGALIVGASHAPPPPPPRRHYRRY